MILSSSNNLYTPPPTNPEAEIDLSLALGGDLSVETETRQVRIELELALQLGGDLDVQAQSEHSINLGLSLSGDLNTSTRLALVSPEPILNEIAVDAFSKQYYTARLLDNTSSVIQITDAVIDAPKDSTGKKVSITVVRRDLSLITKDKTYTFQVGTRATPLGAITWETIIQGAPLLSRQFSRGVNGNLPADSLSFGALEPLKDCLNRFPTKNRIYFNSNKTDVDISNLEKVYDNLGAEIQTLVFSRSSLDLYYILNQVKTILSFDSIETNIPNFEITRFDFSITQSYQQSLNGVIGIFTPVYFTVGNTLWILDKSAAIPDDFEPRAVSPSEFSNWQISIPEAAPLDGIYLNYIDSNTTADTYTDRLVQTTEETGTFGETDFTRTEIDRTYRDWKNTSNLNQVLRSELIKEVHKTYDNALNLIGRETNDHTYDAQGKRTNSTHTVEARVPDLENAGAAALLTVKRENQTVFYTADIKNARRFLQNKTVTQIRGMIAIDSDNTYFDEPFKQDLIEAHKAGNLTASMTSEFGLLKTITETLTPLGNNQYEVRVSTTDHLRGTTVNATAEPKTGDATLGGIGGRSRQMLILREGLTQSARTGGAIESLSVGELPLIFAEPLVQRIIARRTQGKQSGGITIIGYHTSIERGTFMTVLDRDGETSFGKFITEGYRANFNNLGTPQQTVTTTCELSEI